MLPSTAKRHQNGQLVCLKNESVELSCAPRRRFRITFRGVVSDISQFVLKRTVDSPSTLWNILSYLPTTRCGLIKNSKNFQPLMCQVRHHVLSDSFEYWPLMPEFSSEKFNIMWLTWSIMPHSKPYSSLSLGLHTKNCKNLKSTTCTTHLAVAIA